MKPLVIVLSMIAAVMTVSGAFAGQDTAAERGKALFSNAALGGATSGRSCNSCHPGGDGLAKAAAKDWAPGALEDVVNMCIERAMKGSPLPSGSSEMKDIVAHIKTLRKQ